MCVCSERGDKISHGLFFSEDNRNMQEAPGFGDYYQWYASLYKCPEWRGRLMQVYVSQRTEQVSPVPQPLIFHPATFAFFHFIERMHLTLTCVPSNYIWWDWLFVNELFSIPQLKLRMPFFHLGNIQAGNRSWKKKGKERYRTPFLEPWLYK